MYSNSGGNNYGYGRSGLAGSKNQAHGKYGGNSTTGYGVGQGASASSSFGASSTKIGRSRDSASYGTSNKTSIKDSGAAGSSGLRKDAYDRGRSGTKGIGTTGGYTPNSSTGLNQARTANASSSLGNHNGYNAGNGGYAQSSSILSQSLKHKSSQPGGGLPLGAQKIESSSYGAYGIAKNNKMSDSGRQIVGREEERVVSRGHNGRATINGRKDKYEEHKSSSNTGTQIRGKTFQQYAFGDNYGNTRQFQKPDEDEVQQARDHTTLLRKNQGYGQDTRSSGIRQRFEEEKTTEPTNTKLVSSLKSSNKGFDSSFGGSSGPIENLSMSKKSVSEIVPRGYGYSATGLNNIGNTCFMNSILQCIFATAPLTKYFLTDYSSEPQLRARRLADSYYSLLKSARMSKGGSIAPSELKQQISRVARQFSGYGQQDAQEFLRFLLDGMHNELNRIEQRPKYREIECEKLPIEEQSEQWAQYFAARDSSIITDLFEGQLCSKIECRKCGFKSYTFDNFLDLSVQIPRKAVRYTGYIDVDECLKTFTAPEKMENCGYKCVKCKGIDNMEKDITLFRYPKILVIHLKRFYNSSMRREKLSTTIKIPGVLDMTPYGPFSKHQSRVGARAYKLYGISHHSGTLYGGHYIGDVMNLDDGTWYNCNDSRCHKTISADTNSASAYVLFYIQQ